MRSRASTTSASSCSRSGTTIETLLRRRCIRAAGYEPITYSAEMVRPTVDDLPDHPLPDGLEIRPVRDEDIRGRSGRPTSEAFRDHWGFVEQTEADYQRFLAFPYTDTTLWKIAWDDEGVAGQVKSFIDTAQNAEHGLKRGWTENISTSRRWRRRGVAKALIVESIRELAARGMTEVALGVHTENPNGAYDLYAEPRLRGHRDLDDLPQAALTSGRLRATQLCHVTATGSITHICITQ